MNKIKLAQIIVLLSMTNAFAAGHFEYSKKALITKINAADIKKYEKLADSLIAEFFSSKNMAMQDVPAAMKSELNFKKDILIKKLASVDTKKAAGKNDTKTAATVSTLFEEFVQRIEYVKISEMNKSLVDAINEAKEKNKGSFNCSYPNLDKSKRYLLSTKPG